MNRLRAATLSVADCEAAALRYERWLDYRVVERGRISVALATAWDAPAAAGAPCVVMQPASGSSVFLRLVQSPTVATHAPLRSYGWAAIELCVQDVRAVHAALRDGPFEIIGPPADNPSLPSIYPMQVRGPDGEIVFLTQILQGGPGSGLPTARSRVDAPFIAVLAARDLAATAAWFETRLGLRVATPIAIPYRMLTRSFSLPTDHLHTITTASDEAGDICIEIDQYPMAAIERPALSGHLAPGMSICTLMRQVATYPAVEADDTRWLQPPCRHEGIVYGGARSGVLVTPDGALVELLLDDVGDDVIDRAGS